MNKTTLQKIEGRILPNRHILHNQKLKEPSSGQAGVELIAQPSMLCNVNKQHPDKMPWRRTGVEY
jgi:hypothetical protein